MKPDWATRLQRTFARKYDAGFAKGLMLGKAVATRDEQERIIEVLEQLKAKCEHKLSVSKPFTESSNQAYIALKAFQVAIALIKGESK